MPHNVDFHAVTGQGGGAADTTVDPGETKTIEARLLYPGMFMYHCAAGDVPLHIVEGMYGGILVDPARAAAGGRARAVHGPVGVLHDRPAGRAADDGSRRVTDEHPQFVVFNGAVGSLTGDNAPHINVGETMRIYFVNAGLNLDSNFHPIGSHWDKVYQEGALLNQPLRGSQTTLVPAGGSTVVELIGQVPQTIVLVDHALARAFDKGAIGQIVVDGEPNPGDLRGGDGERSAGLQHSDCRSTSTAASAAEPRLTSPGNGTPSGRRPGQHRPGRVHLPAGRCGGRVRRDRITC